jgi:putative transposase
MRKRRRERPVFVKDGVYHIYNRGVAKGTLFRTANDYAHFLDTLSFYREAKPVTKLSLASRATLAVNLSQPPQRPLVDILSFCLMDNHFHLTVRQCEDDGISSYLSQVQNSYSRYFNVKYDRVGTMFQGRFQAVSVRRDEQLLHLTRYHHLNPVVARLVERPEDWPWSSYASHYLKNISDRLCQPQLVIKMVGSREKYRAFVQDYIDYARSVHELKHLFLE